MRYIKPNYFDDFTCAADKCPDTCCTGWQIVIDDDALERYMQESSDFRNRLAGGIDWREGCFRQYNGRCSMLNENNLCDMVTALGEKSLCETCSRYPRHVEEFEGQREWSLSLSCPIAAHMMLDTKEPMRFTIKEDDEEDPLEDEFEDFDLLLFTQLEDARKILFQIVQNRALPIEQRRKLVLEMAEQMQACLDEDRLFDMDELIASYAEIAESAEKDPGIGADAPGSDERYRTDSTEDSCPGMIGEPERFQELQKQFAVFYRLERLRDEWSDVLEKTQHTLFDDCAGYQQIRQEFLAEYSGCREFHDWWECFQENLMMFFLYTYFCGAVYDGWIYSKAALAVFSAVFICEFIMCRWYLSEKKISLQECVEISYRYAREVEHSDDNLNLLEEWLMEHHI